jgi:hypothetical protein
MSSKRKKVSAFPREVSSIWSASCYPGASRRCCSIRWIDDEEIATVVLHEASPIAEYTVINLSRKLVDLNHYGRCTREKVARNGRPDAAGKGGEVYPRDDAVR